MYNQTNTRIDMAEFMQEINERLTRLETKHEERHVQSMSLFTRMESTQERLVSAVESLVITQSKMQHLGGRVDKHGTDIDTIKAEVGELKTKQSVMWKALGVVGTAITSLIVAAAFKMYGGS